jgi:hypothetical protein
MHLWRDFNIFVYWVILLNFVNVFPVLSFQCRRRCTVRTLSTLQAAGLRAPYGRECIQGYYELKIPWSWAVTENRSIIEWFNIANKKMFHFNAAPIPYISHCVTYKCYSLTDCVTGWSLIFDYVNYEPILPSQFCQEISVWTHFYDIKLKIVLQLGVRSTQRDPAFHSAFISLTFSSIAFILCTAPSGLTIEKTTCCWGRIFCLPVCYPKM